MGDLSAFGKVERSFLLWLEMTDDIFCTAVTNFNVVFIAYLVESMMFGKMLCDWV